MENSNTYPWCEYTDWLRHQLKPCTAVTARQLSLYSGISNGTISAHVRGNVKPQMGTITTLANYFGVDPNWLLRKAGYAVEEPPYELTQVGEQFVRKVRRLPPADQDEAFGLAAQMVDALLKRGPSAGTAAGRAGTGDGAATD